MHDIVDIIKNVQTLSSNDTAFKILKDFERVLDELDIYVYENWEDGELISGPNVSRYTVSCKFMWPRENMPDPSGGERLLDYGCKITYEKENLMVPRKVYKPEDYRPGTKKGKIDAHPVWIVSITMPKKLMQDIFQGYTDKENRAIADSMKYEQMQQANQSVEQDASTEMMPTDTTGEAGAETPTI
jgi:hypothetical protein